MDGWEEDDFIDEFDDVDTNDTAAGAQPSSSAANGAGTPTIQSFQQHHELDLSFGAPAPAGGAAAFGTGVGYNDTSDTGLNFNPANNEEGWSDDDLLNDDAHDELNDTDSNNKATAEEGMLSRAAGVFGAALLASVEPDPVDYDRYDAENHNAGHDSAYVDNNAVEHEADEDADEEEEEADDDEEEEQPSFGFGGGFVMKGLRGFIDAATAPKNNAEDESEGDGWDDDDDLGLDDDLDDELEDGGLYESESQLVSDSQFNVEGRADEMNVNPETNQDAKMSNPSLMEINKPIMSEPSLVEAIDEPLTQEGNDGGWDDDFVDLDALDDAQSSEEPYDEQHETVAKPSEQVTAADTTKEIPDSLKDFVALAESKLNSAFHDAVKTPTRTPRDKADGQNNNEAGVEANLVKVDDEEVEQEEEEDECVVSKSLTDFVDNLDAELNHLKAQGLGTSPAKPTTLHDQDEYNFDENKDNSPEPIDASDKHQRTMPHQDSWYLNAMEGGAGGIVQEFQSPPPHVEKESILPLENSGLDLNDVNSEHALGMPLSEFPSQVNSESSHDNGSSNNLDSLSSMTENNHSGACNYEKSELKCTCLELILPLPENGTNNSSTSSNNSANINHGVSQQIPSGYGTKLLNGTLVLVHYEKLLQNEATKRILLQRSIEAYERTMEKMQARHASMTKSCQEQEVMKRELVGQLEMVRRENESMQELVAQLKQERDEMKTDTPESEAHLLQEELGGMMLERDGLKRKLEEMEGQLDVAKRREVELMSERDGMGGQLDELRREHSHLRERMEGVQSELMEVQQSNSLLASENEALKQELNAKSIESVEMTTQHEELSGLKRQLSFMEQQLQVKSSDFEVLEDELAEIVREQAGKESEMDRLRQENNVMLSEISSVREALAAAENEKESLSSMQNDSQGRISELTAMVEMLEGKSEEVDRLAAENASLTYALEVKSSEFEEHVASLKSLQMEYDNAKSQLSAVGIASNNESAAGEQIVMLENKLKEKTSDCDVLNQQLEEMLSEQAKKGTEIQRLSEENNQMSTEVSGLRERLAAAESEKESLHSLQIESQAKITELTAVVGTMDNFSSEVDRLASENASHTNELGVKSSENNEHLASVKFLQMELDTANARILALDQASNDKSDSSGIVTSLKAENEALKTNISNLQNNCTTLERCRLDLESTLEEQRRDMESMKCQVEHLESQATQASLLRSQIVELKETAERKENELQGLVSAYNNLNAQLTSLTSANNRQREEELAESREELSNLQSQFDEYKQHHDSTMSYMEEQLSDLMQLVSSLNAELDKCKNDLESSRQENLELNRTMSENEAKYAQQVFQLEGENLELSAALKIAKSSEVNEESSTLRVKELEEENSRSIALLDQFDQATVKADETISDLKAEIKDLSAEYKEMKLAFDRIQMENGNLLARNRALEQDNKSLEFQLTEKLTKSNQIMATNRVLEQDKQSLEFQLNSNLSKLEKLEAHIASLQAQMEEQEKEALDAIAQWEARCSSLERSREESDVHSSEQKSLAVEEIVALNKQVDNLTSQLQCAQSSQGFTSAEREKLLARIAELEKEIKDENITELRDELTSLHEERQQLDLDNEELLVQLGLMQQSKIEQDEEMQDELFALREQVATLQDDIANLQRDLIAAKTSNTTDADNGLSAVVEKLHKENIDLQSNISKLGSEKGSLESDIDNLTVMVKNLEQQLSGSRESDDAEVQRLKAQVTDLEMQLSIQEQDVNEVERLKTQVHELEVKLSQKEQDAAAATEEMKQALEQKDDDILKLTAEGFLRETTLKDMKREAEARHIVDSMQVNITNDEQDISEEEGKEYDDDDSLQDLLADDIESDDYLRHQIVILAQALERSELQRADVLDRITRERKSNADSLKQLGESVKRFYSTVR